MLKRGFLRLGRLGGVPILVHWTAPVGAYVFAGFRFDGVSWAGFFGLVLLHELGHALMVRAAGARTTEVEVTGVGGLCRWHGEVSPLGRSVIAWGGVWAQLALLVGVEAWLWLSAPALLPPVASALVWLATVSNAWLIALNLLPFSPLDGAEAWRLPWLLGVAARRRLSNFRDPVHQPARFEDPDEDAALSGTPRGEEAKQIAAELLRQAAEEQHR